MTAATTAKDVRRDLEEDAMGWRGETQAGKAESEWELLTLRGLSMTDETAGEFTGTLVIHRRGSAEPVEHVTVRIKRNILEEMSTTLQRLLARSTRYTR